MITQNIRALPYVTCQNKFQADERTKCRNETNEKKNGRIGKYELTVDSRKGFIRIKVITKIEINYISYLKKKRKT